MGVNVPNFGPGTEPGVLRRWAQTVEGLGFDLLMISDHIAVTPDVAGQYPASFYEPFTTLAWLAGITGMIRLGTTVLIVPYRHPLLSARMAANLNDLSGGRLVLGVGAGWAVQEFDALGVPFGHRGKLTDDYLRAVRAAWADEQDYRGGRIPIWVGGKQRCWPAPGGASGRGVASAAVHHAVAAQGGGPDDGVRRRAATTGPGPGPAHRLAAGRITGHRPRAPGRRGHDPPGPRRPRKTEAARGRPRCARSVQQP